MKRLAMAAVAVVVIAEPAFACCPGSMAPSAAAPRPSVPHVQRPSAGSILPVAPALGAVSSAVVNAREFADVKAKVRAKNPHATDEQIEAGAQIVIKTRRNEERADKARGNAIETALERVRHEREMLVITNKEATARLEANENAILRREAEAKESGKSMLEKLIPDTGGLSISEAATLTAWLAKPVPPKPPPKQK